MVAPLCVRLFGTPNISYDARPVRFVAPRSLPLFAYLVLNRDRSIARDQLAYQFWPDVSESEARANLRRHLHRINKALYEVSAQRWLAANDKVVGLDPQLPLELDVVRLEAACSDPTLAEGAVEIYTGDLFEGCEDEWLIPHRERLRTAHLQMLFGLIDRYRGERRFSEAIALSQRVLHLDPFREDAVRTLMSLHYESGDRSSALADFAAFRERLHMEFGADPMRETQSLHEAIRRYAAVDAPQTDDRPSVERSMPFAGRTDEIDALRTAWRQAARGKGRVAVVSGEAGIGKTRLLREFATIAEREGARVLWGRSSAPEASPYEPVTEALAGAISDIARLTLSPALLAALAVRFPELRASHPDMPESVGLIDERERERFFEAVALAIGGLSAARPTVLVLEDLHWVLADTLELIARIARTCLRSPLLAVVTFREEHMTGPLRLFRVDPSMKRALRVGLRRLESSACRSILQRGHEDVPVEAADWAIELAQGNPLFLSELVRDYSARKTRNLGEQAALPTSIETAILARLSNLSESARSVLDVAAIGGTIVSIDVVQHVCGWPLAEVLDATDELVDRFVLRETATGLRGDYQFAHELIRDAVVRSMPGHVQTRRHRRFAKAQLALFPTRQDELARTLAQHFEKGEQSEEAARFYARAASVAQAQFAWQDAMALAEHALRLERRPQECFSLHAIIESAASKSGDRGRQQGAVATMLRLADDLDDDLLRATALQRSSELGLQTGDFERHRHATDRLESIARMRGDTSLLRQALRCRAAGETALDRPASAVAAMHEIDAIEGLSRSISERIDDLRLTSHAHMTAANFEAARLAIDEAVRHAGPTPTLADQLLIVRTQANNAVGMGERDVAARLAPVLLELCEKVGDVDGLGNAHQIAARIDWWAFDIASAREHLCAATAIFERIGKPQSLAGITINFGALENHVGLLDDAERLYAQALTYANRIDSDRLRAFCYGNFAYVALLKGDGKPALAHAERALELGRKVNNVRRIAVNLGQCASAMRLLGQNDAQSLASFSEALKMCETFGLVDERLEIITEMIPALLSCGRLDNAARFATELDRAIAADENAVVMPVDALAKAADAFEALGDASAARALRERARTLLRDRLDKLPDERTRAAYATLPFHRAVLNLP